MRRYLIDVVVGLVALLLLMFLPIYLLVIRNRVHAEASSAFSSFSRREEIVKGKEECNLKGD